MGRPFKHGQGNRAERIANEVGRQPLQARIKSTIIWLAKESEKELNITVEKDNQRNVMFVGFLLAEGVRPQFTSRIVRHSCCAGYFGL